MLQSWHITLNYMDLKRYTEREKVAVRVSFMSCV